jgi:hypothetical protein
VNRRLVACLAIGAALAYLSAYGVARQRQWLIRYYNGTRYQDRPHEIGAPMSGASHWNDAASVVFAPARWTETSLRRSGVLDTSR